MFIKYFIDSPSPIIFSLSSPFSHNFCFLYFLFLFFFPQLNPSLSLFFLSSFHIFLSLYLINFSFFPPTSLYTSFIFFSFPSLFVTLFISFFPLLLSLLYVLVCFIYFFRHVFPSTLSLFLKFSQYQFSKSFVIHAPTLLR